MLDWLLGLNSTSGYCCTACIWQTISIRIWHVKCLRVENWGEVNYAQYAAHLTLRSFLIHQYIFVKVLSKPLKWLAIWIFSTRQDFHFETSCFVQKI